MAHQSEHPEAAHTPRFTTALKDGAPSRIQVDVQVAWGWYSLDELKAEAFVR